MADRVAPQPRPAMPVLPSQDVLNRLTPSQRQLVEQRVVAVQQGQWVELKKGLGADYPVPAAPASPPPPAAPDSEA